MNTDTEVRRELRTTASLLSGARDQLAAGGNVELSALESQVERICGMLAALPRELALSFKTPMIALIDDLDRLSADLTVHHAELSRQLKGLADHRQATTAYGNTSIQADNRRSKK